jgi:hypothetical protein
MADTSPERRRCTRCRCFLASDQKDTLCSPCAGSEWGREHAAEIERESQKKKRADRAQASRRKPKDQEPDRA